MHDTFIHITTEVLRLLSIYCLKLRLFSILIDTPSMPSNFSVITYFEEVNNWVIELVWMPPVGSFVNYYNLQTNPSIDNKYCINGNCSTSIIFEDLNVSQIYLFSFFAVNCIGNGQLSLSLLYGCLPQ